MKIYARTKDNNSEINSFIDKFLGKDIWILIDTEYNHQYFVKFKRKPTDIHIWIDYIPAEIVNNAKRLDGPNRTLQRYLTHIRRGEILPISEVIDQLTIVKPIQIYTDEEMNELAGEYV